MTMGKTLNAEERDTLRKYRRIARTAMDFAFKADVKLARHYFGLADIQAANVGRVDLSDRLRSAILRKLA
jgi:hypothetical protein